MKQSQSFAVYALLFAVLLLLSGCGQPSTDTTATQQPTQIVSQNSDGSVQVFSLVSDTIAYDGEHGVGRGGKSPDTLIVRFSLDEQQIIQTVETTFEAGSPKSSQYQAMFQ
jgi:hypothetical protein